MDGNSFAELVRASRSYRRFTGEPASREALLGLIDVARFAPTGNNTQLLRYAVASDPTTVAELGHHHGWAAALPEFPGPAEGEQPGGYIGIFVPAGGAKSAIRQIDVGIAAQTLCLAACAQGLGACMIKSYDAQAASVLGVTGDDYALALMIAFGKPAPDEKTVLESMDADHGTKYWRTEGNVHHVPKRSVEDLLL